MQLHPAPFLDTQRKRTMKPKEKLEPQPQPKREAPPKEYFVRPIPGKECCTGLTESVRYVKVMLDNMRTSISKLTLSPSQQFSTLLKIVISMVEQIMTVLTRESIPAPAHTAHHPTTV